MSSELGLHAPVTKSYEASRSTDEVVTDPQDGAMPRAPRPPQLAWLEFVLCSTGNNTDGEVVSLAKSEGARISELLNTQGYDVGEWHCTINAARDSDHGDAQE
jgi:hypothetical protein